MPPKEGAKGSFHGKLRRLGLLDSRSSSKSKQLTFELYFPRPPYHGAQYRAARGKDGLFNFVGLVLGHGGGTVQRIQKAAGAKIEVRDSAGNLSGAHPSSHGDPTLHAWVCAASQARLAKAVALLLEVLQPTNGRLRKFGVEPGGSVVLEPEAARAGPAPAGPSGSAREQATDAAPASPSSAPALNAWDSKRLLLKPRPDGRHISPTSTLERRQAAAAVAESCASSDTDEAEDGGGQDYPPPLSPPPPPPPRSPHAAAPPLGPPTPIAMLPPAADAQQQPLFPAFADLQPLPAQPLPAQPPRQHLAPSWAGDHLVPSSSRWPAAPAALDHGRPSAPGAGSWSLWDGASPGPSFYEQLQAAALDALQSPGGGVGGGAAPGAAPSLPHMHVLPAAPAAGHAQPPCMGLVGHAGQPEVAPFPGLMPRRMDPPLGLPPAQYAQPPRLDPEPDMQQLLAALSSLATYQL